MNKELKDYYDSLSIEEKIAFDKAYDEGYREGLKEGREEGYDEGYNHGYKNCEDDNFDSC